MEPPVDTDNALIREIDTIIGGPHIGRESRNAQKEAKDPPMISYLIIITPCRIGGTLPKAFTHDDAFGFHYSHCDALMVRAIVEKNGLKRVLVDN